MEENRKSLEEKTEVGDKDTLKPFEKLLIGFAIIYSIASGIYIDTNMPKYAGYPSKNGNIPITVFGEITEGSYKHQDITTALYNATCEKINRHYEQPL